MKSIERMFYVLLLVAIVIFMIQFHLELFVEIVKWAAIVIGFLLFIIFIGL